MLLSRILRCPRRRVLSSHFLKVNLCTKSEVPNEKDNYSIFYKLPQMRICSAINKFKKLQLWAAGSTIPCSTVAYWLNLCDSSVPSVVATIAVASSVAIFSVGQLFTNLIGFVYVNEEKNEIKISYLDFWGIRKDVIYGLEDFLPLSHSPRYPTDFLFRKLYVYSSRHPFKLCIRYGDIVDLETFKTVFCYDD